MAQWLSWLERRPVTAEVVGSSPIWVVFVQYIWGLSSAGRASALQAEGHRFEPYRPHCYYSADDDILGEGLMCISRCGSMAEQLICNQQVIGSSPIIGFWICFLDGFPSGQRGQTVNLLQIASVVRIHLHPFALWKRINFSA